FDQIHLQALGSAALLRPERVPQLLLTAKQRRQLNEIEEATQKELRELQEKVKAGQEKDGSSQSARIQTRTDTQRAAVLTDEQRRMWATMVGQPFDFKRVRKTAVRAPEVRDIEAWVNSEPLTLEGLRGRVVALHFWTFG